MDEKRRKSISNGMKSSPLVKANLANLAKAKTGTHLPEEQRRAISESMKASWAKRKTQASELGHKDDL